MKKSHGNASDQSLIQQLVKGLSNAAFACFILGVLILTVVSLRYQPPDPWAAEPEKALDQVLSAVQNATFRTDDSVLRTGEDFSLSAAENETASEVEGPAITLNTLVLTQQDEGKSSTTSTNTEEEEVVVYRGSARESMYCGGVQKESRDSGVKSQYLEVRLRNRMLEGNFRIIIFKPLNRNDKLISL